MKISTFCGCCSLQIGSIIVGVLGFVYLSIVLTSASIVTYKIDAIYNVPEFRQSMYWPLKSAFVAIISWIVMMLILTILLIVGAIKKKASFVFPSVCIGFANIMGNLGISIGQLLFVYIALTGYTIFLISFFIGIVLAVQIYLWLILYFFYKELIAEKYGHTVDHSKIYSQPIGFEV